MVTPKPSGHTTGRLDHPNPGEAEENNFKCNFMSMMETFREEMEKKTSKILEEINKSLKETKKIKKKQ